MKNVIFILLSLLLINRSFTQVIYSRTQMIDIEKSVNKLAVIELNPTVYNSINIKYPKSLESYIRYKINDQNNGDWILLKSDPHNIDIYESSEFLSSMIIVGLNEKQFFLSYDGAQSGAIELEIYEDSLSYPVSKNIDYLSSENCICSPPSYKNRTDWGCPWGDESPNFMPIESNITHFVIHHQGGSAFPPYDATIRAIWNYHVNSNGWEDIGYHWLIDPEGIIYKGRAWIGDNENVLGAHMCGCNANKLGICLLGDLTDQGPTGEQYSSLIDLLTYKCCNWNISPDLESMGTDRTSGNCQTESVNHIISHRDGCPLNYTECPGAAFYSQFNQLKNDVKTSYSNCILNTDISEERPEKFMPFPNPIISDFTIKSTLKNDDIKIYDLHGREINFLLKTDYNHSNITILAPGGTYIVKSTTNPSFISKLTKL